MRKWPSQDSRERQGGGSVKPTFDCVTEWRVLQQHQYHHQMEVGTRPTTLDQDHQQDLQATTNQLPHQCYLKKITISCVLDEQASRGLATKEVG
jgi:hypothetical protein